jgi:osmotically-inducible protein OsmY
MARVQKGAVLPSIILTAAFALAGCSSLPARSAAQAAADKETSDRVYAALQGDPIYYFVHVNVRVEHGVARLSGVVWSTEALIQAQNIARAVPGVTAVDDELELERAALRGGGDGGG